MQRRPDPLSHTGLGCPILSPHTSGQGARGIWKEGKGEDYELISCPNGPSGSFRTGWLPDAPLKNILRGSQLPLVPRSLSYLNLGSPCPVQPSLSCWSPSIPSVDQLASCSSSFCLPGLGLPDPAQLSCLISTSSALPAIKLCWSLQWPQCVPHPFLPPRAILPHRGHGNLRKTLNQKLSPGKVSLPAGGRVESGGKHRWGHTGDSCRVQ